MDEHEKKRKKDKGYKGAETISGAGRITRPGEASVLLDEEERLKKINRRFSSTHQKTVQHKSPKKRISDKPIIITPSDNTHTEVGHPLPGEQRWMLFLPKALREYLLGDLAEEYCQIQVKQGTSFANLWYWYQVTISILVLTPRAIVKWLLGAVIGDWIRRNNL